MDTWLKRAERLDWHTKPTKAGAWSFTPPVSISWYEDGALNVSANCLDRHAAATPNKIALIWEPDEPGQGRRLSYAELLGEVEAMAAALLSFGVKPGDVVGIYLPMIPEAVVAMLACARIGAVHNVVFAGFSPDSLAARLSDSGARVLITADEGRRGGRSVPLKANVDAALASAACVERVLCVRHTGAAVSIQPGRDVWWHDVRQLGARVPAQAFPAEHPLFILYTSGSTGKPKGLLHTSGGYLVWASYTHAEVFGLKPDDVYFCTADVGWITGHSYIVYAPLCNGATVVLFEGVPSYPAPDRLWRIIDEHRVTLFYTAPTAIRALMREGDQWLAGTRRDSQRVLGSVGEPINEDAWRWYHERVGLGRCKIVDTWWQTETGGILISPTAAQPLGLPGYAMTPLDGIEPVLLSDKGAVVTGEGEGLLCLAASWPGQARTIWGDHARFEQTYFSTCPGTYFSGDGARRDAAGRWRITGRVDDVLNVAGHRLSTAEIEASLGSHAAVAESAVVGMPHPIKGEGIYCFVVLKAGFQGDAALEKTLKDEVRHDIGAIATPERIQFVSGLPKTRSGKIMRRILRKIVHGEEGQLGDISTLADPGVVAEILAGRL